MWLGGRGAPCRGRARHAAPDEPGQSGQDHARQSGPEGQPQEKGGVVRDIVLNLNWSHGRRTWGSRPIDLDLGCLYELSNGDRHVVQALGRDFGSFAEAPYIDLSGDDRTGDVAGGETMRINGRRWGAIRRVLVFATIYEGVTNWQATDGVVTVTVPDQPPLEVPLAEGRNDRRLCGIVLLDNVAGRIETTRIMEYFPGQRALDQRFGWGLRWVAGHKD